MKTDIDFWSYLAHFFLKWKMFRQNLCRKQKHTFYINFFSRKSCPLWENMKKKKYRRAGQAADDNVAQAHWMLIPQTANTLTICNTFCFSTTKTVAGTHLNVTLYLHCLPWYLLNLQHLVTYVLLLHYRIILSGLFVRDGSFSLTSS